MRGGVSVFDEITEDDLLIAFFPCIYFCAFSQVLMSWTARNYSKLSIKERSDAILRRSHHREYYFGLLVKLFTVTKNKGLRLIVENPWSQQTFLKGGFLMPPTLVDDDRTRRGDYFKKPTAYWFVNCDPTFGLSYEVPVCVKSVVEAKKSKEAGVCSTERSMIAPAYAKNFISDFIFGVTKEEFTLGGSLFDGVV